MALVISKSKTKTVTSAKKVGPELKPGEMLSDFAELIDRVGALGKEAAEIKAQIKKLQEQLKPYNDAVSELEAKLDELGGDPDQTLPDELGSLYRLQIGKMGTQRTVSDVKKVHAMLGDELFYQIASVKLKDIDNYLTLPQRQEVIEEQRTTRSFKVVERA